MVKPEKQERFRTKKLHPFIGLATVLGSILLFLAVLVAITALIHWIMM